MQLTECNLRRKFRITCNRYFLGMLHSSEIIHVIHSDTTTSNPTTLPTSTETTTTTKPGKLTIVTFLFWLFMSEIKFDLTLKKNNNKFSFSFFILFIIVMFLLIRRLSRQKPDLIPSYFASIASCLVGKIVGRNAVLYLDNESKYHLKLTFRVVKFNIVLTIYIDIIIYLYD